MDFPSPRAIHPPIMTSFHEESAGLGAYMAGLARLSDAISAVWPAANQAFFYPVRLNDWATVFQLLFWVGATSNGNIDVAIYDSQFNLIVSAGSTAMSATVNTVQELNITDTVLAPGDYYLAVACSSGTGTTFRITQANDEIGLAIQPLYQQGSAFPLPDPASPTITTDSSTFYAVVGIQLVPTF